MYCSGIALTDFRNIASAAVSFDQGVNVLYGNNAQGKTNLLEGIYFAAIGKSFRGQHAPEVIRFGAEYAALSLDYTAGGREQNISMRLFPNNRARAVEKNKVRISRMSELLGSFRAVLFCPEHLSLIKGGPAERRQFLDIAVSASEPVYLATLQRYGHILKQRNALIRKAKEEPEMFESTVDLWSAQLAKEGAYIARSRQRYIKRAEKYVKECFAAMTGEKEAPTLFYHGPDKSGSDYEDVACTEKELYRLLSTAHEREIGAGSTLWGIHKDDIEVELNRHSARLFCSQGQQRSLALALKLAEGEICREDCGEYPVFLFDDVLSELDARRRAYLLEKMEGKQVIMTACEQLAHFSGKLFYVENGAVKEM
ncbi:MAG: DNA replication/repair protein RecF [Ruminococcaceae bacterium]|nr:DNA replication/repair protein RecF [Oscillospiraceae bacterium]